MVKEIQRLIRMIMALSKFVSRSTDKCLPFFQALKGKGKINWDSECGEAFQGLKMYLASTTINSFLV